MTLKDTVGRYVMGDAEVRLTGRVATRPMPGGRSQELVEITPADENEGTWKKWVPEASLFKISGEAPAILKESSK